MLTADESKIDFYQHLQLPLSLFSINLSFFVLILALRRGAQHVKISRQFGMTLDHGQTISPSKLQKWML